MNTKSKPSSLTDYGIKPVYVVTEDEPTNADYPSVIVGVFKSRDAASTFIGARKEKPGVTYNVEEWPVL